MGDLDIKKMHDYWIMMAVEGYVTRPKDNLGIVVCDGFVKENGGEDNEDRYVLRDGTLCDNIKAFSVEEAASITKSKTYYTGNIRVTNMYLKYIEDEVGRRTIYSKDGEILTREQF